MTVRRIIAWETWGPPDMRWAACEAGREEEGARVLSATREDVVLDIIDILNLEEGEAVEVLDG